MRCGELGFVGKDGTPCRQDIAATSKGCVWHSPDTTPEQRAAVTVDAVKAKSNHYQLPPEYKVLFSTRQGIIATAKDLAEKVATGNMDVKRATFVLKAARLANETLDGINTEKVTAALLSMEHGSTAVALYQRLTEGPMRALPLGGATSDGEIIDVETSGSTEEVVERLAEAMGKVKGPRLGPPRPGKIRRRAVDAAFAALDAEDDDEPTEIVSYNDLKKPPEDAASNDEQGEPKND